MADESADNELADRTQRLLSTDDSKSASAKQRRRLDTAGKNDDVKHEGEDEESLEMTEIKGIKQLLIEKHEQEDDFRRYVNKRFNEMEGVFKKAQEREERARITIVSTKNINTKELHDRVFNEIGKKIKEQSSARRANSTG